MKSVSGLDFGTSNTICSVVKNCEDYLVPLEEDNPSIPSCIFFPFKEIDFPIYGERATQTYINGGYGRYMKSFKRILGTSFFDSGTLLKPGLNIKFHKIIVSYLKHVKTTTESFIGSEVDYVVAGKPVRLSENDRNSNKGIKQLELILQDVGYKNFSFLEEPIAAAYYHRDKILTNSVALVADLGGGTCDFTVVKNEKVTNQNQLQILSTSGLSLGGTDIDSDFALNIFFPELGYKTIDRYKGLTLADTPYRYASDWNKITTSLYTPKTEILIKKMIGLAKEKEKVLRLQKLVENKDAHSLLSQIENAKIKLSSSNSLSFQSEFLNPSRSYNITVKELNNTIGHFIDKLLTAVNSCISSANINDQRIDYLILTGGTSKLPILRNKLQEKFNEAEIIDSNTMDSVGLGLLEKAKKDILND